MTGALTVLANFYEVNNLTYIAGKRSGGIVAKGTEKLLTISPYAIILDKKFSNAVTFFDKYQFAASLEIIGQVENIATIAEAPSRFSSLKKAALAYSAWDKFDHQKAFELLRQVDLSLLDSNKAFLAKMLKDQSREPYYISDLLNNAMRREQEGKYDDAVARLYRVIELIGQYKLKAYGIEDSGNVPREKIPASLRGQFQDKKGKIQIGLDMDYRFLAEFRDGLGDKFTGDSKTRDTLKKRNESILAHGLKSVDQDAFEKLLSAAMDFAKSTIKDLNTLLSESSFIKWPK